MYQKKKSKKYEFSILDLQKRAFENGLKNEKGRRNNKEASIGDRDAFEVKKDV
jgi:hypothetical protein